MLIFDILLAKKLSYKREEISIENKMNIKRVRLLIFRRDSLYIKLKMLWLNTVLRKIKVVTNVKKIKKYVRDILISFYINISANIDIISHSSTVNYNKF